jgi:hypothetical protein
MAARTNDILYVQRRLNQTRLQADAATEGCARVAHLGLAELYRCKVLGWEAAQAGKRLVFIGVR